MCIGEEIPLLLSCKSAYRFKYQLPTRLLPMGAPCLVNVVKEWPPKRKAELQLGDKRKAEKESLGSCRSIKLRYSEKAKMFWKNDPLFLTLLINFRKDFSKWIFFWFCGLLTIAELYFRLVAHAHSKLWTGTYNERLLHSQKVQNLYEVALELFVSRQHLTAFAYPLGTGRECLEGLILK